MLEVGTTGVEEDDDEEEEEEETYFLYLRPWKWRHYVTPKSR
jgi:hypothetical protein